MKPFIVAAFVFIAAVPVFAGETMYHDGWIDFNKNGKKDLFEDPTQPLENRVEDLLAQMTVAEKTCQLATLYGYGRVLKDPLPTPAWKHAIWKDGVANIDEMHNGIGKFGAKNNPHLAIAPAAISTNGELTVTCAIQNTGSRAGDEIAQLYFHQETSSVTTYELNLAGFERVSLQPGESKTVTFKLPASFLEIIDRDHRRVVEPGKFNIMIGASSEDLRLKGDFDVVETNR